MRIRVKLSLRHVKMLFKISYIGLHKSNYATGVPQKTRVVTQKKMNTQLMARIGTNVVSQPFI
jgi:hypothetical protein